MSREKNDKKSAAGLDSGGMEKLLRAREAYGRADGWQEELSVLAEKYPALDIKAGLQKPRLRELLRAGCDFTSAFEAANIDEIVKSAELDAERRMASRLESNAARTEENGVAASRSAPFTWGGRGMSKKDRQDIVDRVLRGEEIRL